MRELLAPVLICVTVFVSGCASDPHRSPPGRQKQPARSVQELPRPVKQFWIDYNFEPVPGKRIWTRLDNTTWTETYPNGTVVKYRIKERGNFLALSGETVERLEGNSRSRPPVFEAFIPDRESRQMIVFVREFENGAWRMWRPLGAMNVVE